MSRNIRGAGHHETPVLLMRQVLMEGLVELAGDRERLEELFGRVDDLLTGTAGEYLEDFIGHFVDRVSRLNGPDGVRIRLGYPHADDMVLPHIGLVVESGAEDTGSAVSGNLQREETTALGTAPTTAEYAAGQFGSYTVEERATIGVGWSTNVQLSCWALSGEEAELWTSAVLNVLVRDQGRLYKGGIREIRLSESGFSPADQYQPRVMYVPVVRVTAMWDLRQTMREKAPYAVTLSKSSFGN